ncbi:MAG: hypothetical protein J6W79_02805, partial [Alphaproteobacteria bacterium]|nr:hypothetical protein [Alphaproteobacteria bacterium]
EGIVEIYGQTKEGFLGGLQILSDGRVQIVNSRHEKRTEIAKTRNESNRATIKFFGDVMNGVGGVVCDFNNTVRTTIIEGGKVVGITIQEFGATVRNVLDNATKVTVESMESGVELVVNYSKERTNRIKIRANRTVEIAGEVGETIRGTWKTTTDGIVNIYATTGEIFIGGLKILKDGTVEIFKSTGATIQTIVKAKTEAYIATIKFFGSIISEFGETARTAIIEGGKVVGIAIQEFGATVRNVLDNATKVTVEGMENGVELVVNYSKERTNRIKIRADRTVEIAGEVGETIRGTWKETANGIVNMYATTGEVFIGGLRIVKDGTVEIFKSTGATIQTIAREKTKAYIATIKLFGDAINGFNENVKTWIIESGKVVGVTIQTAGAIIMNAMDNATDFAKHFTSEIVGGIEALQINSARLRKLEEDIAKCTTQEQVAEIIAVALREAELNDKQIAQVREMINEYAIEQNQHFEVIENKIKSLEQEIYEIQQQNIIFASQIAGLGVKYTNMQSQYNSLAAEVRTKVNAKQVVNLIIENTQSFTEGQKEELYKILDEYTKKLSPGQRDEVQSMITLYVDPIVRKLNSKINLESDRRVAESRVASAMSVLNSFAASADVSVWKNAEGNFNGARLASDSIAGVVLGTAGGLISNSLIKKSQTKKGFEDIRCTVGGQFVADYDDDFTVGIK